MEKGAFTGAVELNNIVSKKIKTTFVLVNVCIWPPVPVISLESAVRFLLVCCHLEMWAERVTLVGRLPIVAVVRFRVANLQSSVAEMGRYVKLYIATPMYST